MGKANRQLTTGQAAEMLSVKPDTILKWIKAGKLRAVRTAGGHHRIDSRDLIRCLTPASPAEGSAQPFQRCWEYMSRGAPPREDCRRCIVYRTRAGWCFELRRAAPELLHGRTFCPQSCEDCAYYHLVTGRDLRVLVISESASLAGDLAAACGCLADFEQARTEYEASKLIGEFRPACAIVETECVSDAAGLVRCLLEDARVPGLQVLVTADTGEMPPAVIVIGRPLTAEAVARALQRVPVEAYVGC